MSGVRKVAMAAAVLAVLSLLHAGCVRGGGAGGGNAGGGVNGAPTPGSADKALSGGNSSTGGKDLGTNVPAGPP